MYENVTIILQGIMAPHIDLQLLLKEYSKLCPLTIALYDYQLNSFKEAAGENKNYQIIINNQEDFLKELINRGIPETTTTDECYKSFFQICSIGNALQNITSDYVLFCRIDHFFANLEKVIEEGIKEQKFITHSFVVRGVHRRHWRFHFSDCMIFGNTIKMKKLFDLAKKNYTLENITFRPNECRVWRSYFINSIMENNLSEHLSDQEYISYVQKHLIILPVHDLAPFCITFSGEKKTECDYPVERKSTIEYLEYGVQCLGF